MSRHTRNLFICLILSFGIFGSFPSGAQAPENTPNENWDTTIEEARRHEALTDEAVDKIGEQGNDILAKLFKLLEKLSIHYTVGGKIDVIDGLAVNLKYSTKTEPAFYGKYFSRTDKWELQPNAELFEILGESTPAKIGVNAGVQVEFNQFFEKYEDALNPKNMYTPLNLPLKAQAVLEKLKPGDLVSFDGQMSVFYGYKDSLKYFSDTLKVSPTIGGIFSGHFRVYVFRGDNDRIRLRIGAVRNNPKFIKVEAGLLDLFDLGWGPLTSFVTRILKLKSLAEIQFEKYNRDTMLSDFVLDMRDARVRRVYDELFTLSRQADALLRTTNPFSSDKDLKDNLYVNIEKLIELSIDTSKDIDPAVIMNFAGSNFATGSHKAMEGGASLLVRGQKETTSQFNNLKQVLYDSDGVETKRYFVFPSWTEKREHSAIATKWEEKYDRYSNVIYNADENYNILNFSNIGFYIDYTDKEFSKKENDKIISSYKKVLSADIYAQFESYLAQNNWLTWDNKKNNVRISSRYFIHDTGLRYGENVSAAQFEALLLQNIKQLDEESERTIIVPRGDRTARCLKKYDYARDRRGYLAGPNMFKFCRKIAPAAQLLETAMDSSRNKKNRNKDFIALSKNSLFQMIGPSVLLALIPDDKINEVTYFEIAINSSSIKTPLAYRIGQVTDRKLYEIIFQIEDIMSNTPPDLRLAGPAETTTTRIFGGNGH